MKPRASGKATAGGIDVVCDDWTYHAPNANAAMTWRDRVQTLGGCALPHTFRPTATS